MLVLGIETSCDETGAAVVDSDGAVSSDVVQSQVKLHAPVRRSRSGARFARSSAQRATGRHRSARARRSRREGSRRGCRHVPSRADRSAARRASSSPRVSRGVSTSRSSASITSSAICSRRSCGSPGMTAAGPAGVPVRRVARVGRSHGALSRRRSRARAHPRARRDARRRRRRGVRQGREASRSRLSGRSRRRSAGEGGRSRRGRARLADAPARLARIQLFGAEDGRDALGDEKRASRKRRDAAQSLRGVPAARRGHAGRKNGRGRARPGGLDDRHCRAASRRIASFANALRLEPRKRACASSFRRFARAPTTPR